MRLFQTSKLIDRALSLRLDCNSHKESTKQTTALNAFRIEVKEVLEDGDYLNVLHICE